MKSKESNDCHLNVNCKETKEGCDIEVSLPGAESITYKTDGAHHSVTVLAEHQLNKSVIHGGSQTVPIPEKCSLENPECTFAEGVCKMHFHLNQ